MKAQDRHRLKENDFVTTVASATGWLTENRDRVMMGMIAILVVAVLGGGYWYFQKRSNDQAGALLGVAMATAQAQIVPAPSLPGATQTQGTFPTEQARDEAALKMFEGVATSYPSSPAGITARYHMAVGLLGLGKPAEAEKAFQAVADQAGKSIYGPMAKLGRGEALVAQGKLDDAIKAFTDLSADREGAVPVDGVLMQLARVCVKASKPQDARAAFKRVVDEFPDSPYASEARQQLALLG